MVSSSVWVTSPSAMKYAVSVGVISTVARRMIPVRPLPPTVAQNSSASSPSGVRWRICPAPSRCTERPGSARTRYWPGCTPGSARCASSTDPTRCTCGRSPALRSAGRKALSLRRSPKVATDVRDLQGAWNFRDVADTTGILRPGRLFRSGELSELGDEGRDELRRLGVTDVADLRSRSEVLRHGPGLVPDGVDIHLLPIPDL